MKHDSMKHDSVLIRRPGSRPFAVRTAWGVVTAICWVLYAYLWLPLVTLLLWVFGVHTALAEMYLDNRQVDPFMLGGLVLLAIAAAALLIGWAELNRFRFVNRERRSATPDASKAEIAQALGATTQVADALRTGKITVVRMDDRARPHATASRGLVRPSAESAVA